MPGRASWSTRSPGWIRMVEFGSSITAGPLDRRPGWQRWAPHTRAATGPSASSKITLRASVSATVRLGAPRLGQPLSAKLRSAPRSPPDGSSRPRAARRRRPVRSAWRARHGTRRAAAHMSPVSSDGSCTADRRSRVPVRHSAGRPEIRKSAPGSAMPSRANWARAAAASSANTRVTSRSVERSQRPISVRTKSCRHDAISMPSAEKVPGTFGTITVGMKISRAIDHRMQRSGAAECDHRGVARIDAFVDRDRAHRERHRRIGNAHDAERRLLRSKPSGFAELVEAPPFAPPRRPASCRH